MAHEAMGPRSARIRPEPVLCSTGQVTQRYADIKTRMPLHASGCATRIHVVHHMQHPSVLCFRSAKRSPGTCANSTHAGEACNSMCTVIKLDTACTTSMQAKYGHELRSPDMFPCFCHYHTKQKLHTLTRNLGHALSMLAGDASLKTSQSMHVAWHSFIRACGYLYTQTCVMIAGTRLRKNNMQHSILCKKQDLEFQEPSLYSSVAKSSVGFRGLMQNASPS